MFLLLRQKIFQLIYPSATDLGNLFDKEQFIMRPEELTRESGGCRRRFDEDGPKTIE
jgi:hypothetical protein